MALPDISNLRALSIRQPYCENILHDGKSVENRTWPTKFRGRFLIHASKKFEGYREPGTDYPMGGIVGMAEITDCITAMDDPWFYGPYGFLLENIIELPLIPCKGALSFFKPDLKPGIAALWHDGTLSEGQCCALLNMHRIDFREMAYSYMEAE